MQVLRFESYGNVVEVSSFFRFDPVVGLLQGGVTTCDLIFFIGDYGYCLYPSPLLQRCCAHVLDIDCSEQVLSKTAKYVGSKVDLQPFGLFYLDIVSQGWRFVGDVYSKVVRLFVDSADFVSPFPHVSWKVRRVGLEVRVQSA